MLNSQDYLSESGKMRTVAENGGATQRGFGQELVQTLVRSTMEFALQRLVYTLI